MKLVIEIPDNIYRNCRSIPLSPVDCAIKNGKPLDAVLNKIREDIEVYETDCNYQLSEEDNCRTCNKITFGSIYRIIDKYRA